MKSQWGFLKLNFVQNFIIWLSSENFATFMPSLLKHVCYHFILLVINLFSSMFVFHLCVSYSVILGMFTSREMWLWHLPLLICTFVTMQMHLQMAGLIHVTMLRYTYILTPRPIPLFLVNHLWCCYSTIIPLFYISISILCMNIGT